MTTFSLDELKTIHAYMTSVVAVPHTEAGMSQPPYSIIKKLEKMIEEERTYGYITGDLQQKLIVDRI